MLSSVQEKTLGRFPAKKATTVLERKSSSHAASWTGSGKPSFLKSLPQADGSQGPGC